MKVIQARAKVVMSKVVELRDVRSEHLEASARAVASRSNKIKLTANKVANLEAEGKRRWIADTEVPGLYVSVEPMSPPVLAAADADERRVTSKAFYVRGRIGVGRKAPRKDIRIGSVGQVSLSDARDVARRMVVQMREGCDPRRRSEDESSTIAELVAFYEADLQQRGVVRWKDVVGSLNRDLQPLFGRVAKDVMRSEFLDQIEKVRVRVGEPSADALRRHLSGMLNAAVNAQHIAHSPMAGYRKPRATRAVRIARKDNIKRQPNLIGADEFRYFWAATEAAKTEVFRDYLRVLLLTGQRSIELAKAEWSDFDLDSGLWVARPETRKNGEPFTMPLGPLSVEIIGRQTRVSDLVFPGRSGALIVAGRSDRIEPIKEAMAASCGRGDVAYHTLRRAYRTRLSEMGVPEPLAELMTGHQRDDLVGRYDHSDQIDQRRPPQDSYEAWVQEVTEHEG
jgi:integrase